MHRSLAELWNKQIFFIGGSMRSGTTWLQILLHAHPEISCAGEGHYINALGRELAQAIDDYNIKIHNKNAAIFGHDNSPFSIDLEDTLYLTKCAISMTLLKLQKDQNCPIIGEKTPDNIRYLFGLIKLFPTAKFIHIIRDGRDCAISGWFHNLRVSPDWMAKTHPTLAGYVRAFAEEWAEDIRQGHKFRGSFPDCYIELRYEDLVAHPLAALTRIFGFLGASSDPSFVEECYRLGDFRRLSGGRPPGQEDPNSFFRKGEIGDWRDHFTAEMNAEFQQLAGPEMESLGYSG